ncbi:regulatory protein GemA [Niveispirillum sp. KHB5.9]|uniref:regulatory protein GemA n=1 Tax=Niveispirillum sp. KHB5.9 TaxID=3400269 RepID=UPI003A84E911
MPNVNRTPKKPADPAKDAIKAIQTRRRQIPELEDEAIWRDFLRVTSGGVDSLRAMTSKQHVQVLEELLRRGATKGAGRRTLADDPQSRKLRALWLNLYQAGEIQDSSEKALAAWCGRQLGQVVADLRFVHAADKHKLIEALKGWCRRVDVDVEP